MPYQSPRTPLEHTAFRLESARRDVRQKIRDLQDRHAVYEQALAFDPDDRELQLWRDATETRIRRLKQEHRRLMHERALLVDRLLLRQVRYGDVKFPPRYDLRIRRRPRSSRQPL